MMLQPSRQSQAAIDGTLWQRMSAVWSGIVDEENVTLSDIDPIRFSDVEREGQARALPWTRQEAAPPGPA